MNYYTLTVAITDHEIKRAAQKLYCITRRNALPSPSLDDHIACIKPTLCDGRRSYRIGRQVFTIPLMGQQPVVTFNYTDNAFTSYYYGPSKRALNDEARAIHEGIAETCYNPFDLKHRIPEDLDS